MRGGLTTDRDGRGMKRRSGGWRKAGVALTGALFFAMFWVAGPQTLQAEEKSAAVLKAEELMDLVGTEELAQQIIGPTMDQVAAIFTHVNPEQGHLIKYLLKKHVVPEMEGRIPEFIGLSARLYAEHFTAAELEEMIAFYETPLGQKVIAKLPIIQQQSAELGGLWAERVAVDAIEKLGPVIDEYELQQPRRN